MMNDERRDVGESRSAHAWPGSAYKGRWSVRGLIVGLWVSMLAVNVPFDASACQPAIPAFDIAGDPAGFLRKRNRIGVPTFGAPHHRGRDLIAVGDGPQILIGKFAYGGADKDLKGERVEVFTLSDCRWTRSAEVKTTREGDERRVDGVRNDGGRVFHRLDAPLPVGRHPVVLRVAGDHTRAHLTATVVPRGTQTVVFDIDGTLTTGDGEILHQLVDKLGRGQYTPRVRAGAAAVARAWAARGYLVVYLTGRPDLLHGLTRRWLRDEGFPPGPVRYADRLRQARASASGVGRFKAAELTRWRASGLSFAAAYGNASTDITAYAAIGLSGDRTFIVGERGGQAGTTAVPDYRAHLSWVESQPAAGVAAPTGGAWEVP